MMGPSGSVALATAGSSGVHGLLSIKGTLGLILSVTVTSSCGAAPFAWHGMHVEALGRGQTS